MMLYTNRIIEVCNHIRCIMEIIKVYKFICILLTIYFSSMILHNLNSLDTVLHISLDNRNEYMPRTNGRNLAQRNPSREALKRTYDCSLTIDEILRLLHIVHVESIAAGDIITAMILRLDRETGRVNVDGLVRDRLRRHRIANMQARLTELVDEIISISPLNQYIILQKLEAYKEELDETVEILQLVARQRTEEHIYSILNNLTHIRESLNLRLLTNDIAENETAVARRALRIRSRVLDILEFQYDMPSHANSN
ncbi:hypothetical protein PCYB_135460 [Plasmodium cynomolgi strain B]|uniref:Gametocyte associated protein n=1 Tax=Plasmodium cynomolgi (strain B) TaxID=1120755 RepID=K6VH39_PLACD|nr:hypothetical protein PCYB_135460 [Plasmodium cynomolgi strain B]GAB68672.1 hypothetical protein PCYB_135460 [Plasmodium cynomolgi strain B]